MDDYWSVACLLLHARDAFHHIQKANSVEGNGTLRPVSEVEMVNTANFTTLLNKKICYLNENNVVLPAVRTEFRRKAMANQGANS